MCCLECPFVLCGFRRGKKSNNCIRGADQSVQREHTLTVVTNTREEYVKAAAEDFHITPAATPDHVIGEGGPLVMDRQETKTVQYSRRRCSKPRYQCGGYVQCIQCDVWRQR